MVGILLAAACVLWPGSQYWRQANATRAGAAAGDVIGPGASSWTRLLYDARGHLTERLSVGNLGGAVIPVGAAFVVALVATWPWAVSAGLFAATFARLVRHTADASRARKTTAALIDTLRALGRELAAGMPPDAAIATVQRHATPDIAAVLQLAGSAYSQASDLQQVPADLRRDTQQLRAGWCLALAHGLPLAQVVGVLADDIAHRQHTAQARAAQVAGPAVSGYVLAALPVVGLLLGAGMGTDPLAVLGHGTVGSGLLIVGSLLCCAGLWWTDKIVRG